MTGCPHDQSPDEPGTDGWQLVFPVSAAELTVRKDQPDTFAAHPALARNLAGLATEGVTGAGLSISWVAVRLSA